MSGSNLKSKRKEEYVKLPNINVEYTTVESYYYNIHVSILCQNKYYKYTKP